MEYRYLKDYARALSKQGPTFSKCKVVKFFDGKKGDVDIFYFIENQFFIKN
jgi:hypothetical protein